MISKFKLAIAALFICLGMAVPVTALAATSTSSSSNDTHLFDACSSAPSSPVCKQAQAQGTKNPVSGPGGIIQTAANVISLIAAVGAVIVIIVSGFVYATAGGTPGGQRAGDSPNRAANARSTLFNALIGLVVTALAWTIVSFVTQKFIST